VIVQLSMQSLRAKRSNLLLHPGRLLRRSAPLSLGNGLAIVLFQEDLTPSLEAGLGQQIESKNNRTCFEAILAGLVE